MELIISEFVLAPKVYDTGVIAVFAVFAIIGLASANHLRRFSDEEMKLFSPIERRLLRVPGIWLSSSLWLNYLNNLMLGLSVVCSVTVVIMPVFGGQDDTSRIVLYTLASLACSLLYNFSHSKEKSEGYRKAYDLINPLCEQFECLFGPQAENVFDARDRRNYVEQLIKTQDAGEAIIQASHTYNAQPRDVVSGDSPNNAIPEDDRFNGSIELNYVAFPSERPDSMCQFEDSDRSVIYSSWLRSAMYYLYPRPGDALKLMFILEGFAFSVVASGSDVAFGVLLAAAAYVLLVFDFFVYQARYQLNDIRGYHEDVFNSQASRRCRMPVVESLGLRKSMMVSLSIAVARLFAAVIALVAGIGVFGSNAIISLTACSVLALILGIVYERYRSLASKKWHELITNNALLKKGEQDALAEIEPTLRSLTFPTFLFVSFGYPLRIAVGFSFWWVLQRGFSFPDPAQVFLLFAVLLAAALFGESFVTLTWALEASDCKTKAASCAIGESRTFFCKPHIALLSFMLGVSCDEIFPLRGTSPLLRRWNISIWISVAMLLATAFVLASGSDAFVPPLALVGMILLVVALAGSALRQRWMMLWVVVCVLSLCLSAAPMLLAINGVFASSSQGIWLLIAIAEVYGLIYTIFRNMNYDQMHGSFIVKLVHGAVFCFDGILRCVVGDYAYGIMRNIRLDGVSAADSSPESDVVCWLSDPNESLRTIKY